MRAHQRKEIIALTVGSYPYGGAFTNRELSYLRGLAEIGCEVKLLIFSPDKFQSKKSYKKKLTFNKIIINYTCLTLFPSNRILFYINYCYGVIIAFIKLIYFKIVTDTSITIFLPFKQPILLFSFLYVSKILGFKVLHERTEYPFLGMKRKFWLKAYLKYIIPRFNGLIVISLELAKYFENYTKSKILLLPMTVETDRFDGLVREKVEDYIAYCGSMDDEKDGLLDLIKAFKIVNQANNLIKLYLIGDNKNKKKLNEIYNEVKDSGISEKIVFTGFIERDKLPQMLVNARVLVLSRPDSIQARGGFPTKLGEYLLTGNPVVITDVGEHSYYLKNEESAFIAKPNDPTDFAEKVLKALNDPISSKRIGLRGKQVAYESFNYKIQAQKLYVYISDM